jgi:hypothetical protein
MPLAQLPRLPRDTWLLLLTPPGGGGLAPYACPAACPAFAATLGLRAPAVPGLFSAVQLPPGVEPGAGGDVYGSGAPPRACVRRAAVLERTQEGVAAARLAAVAARATLEKVLLQHASTEEARRREAERAARLRRLRRRVADERHAVEELRRLLQDKEAAEAGRKGPQDALASLEAKGVQVFGRVEEWSAGEDGDAKQAAGHGNSSQGGSGADRASSLDEAEARARQRMAANEARMEALSHEVEVRRDFLTAALHSCFPISTASDGVGRTICALPVPTAGTMSGLEDEILAAVLGHACHVVALMAKYAYVALRFQPIPLGSRSCMRDRTIPLHPARLSTRTRDGNDFPLYIKGQDRMRVQAALEMLGADVEQLLAVHGVPRVHREGENPRLAVLANLQAVVIAARQRFLAAVGGIDALHQLDAGTVAALALSQVDVAEAVRFSPERNGASNGGGSRTSSDHGSTRSARSGSAISERSRRSTGGGRRARGDEDGGSHSLAGVEYVSGGPPPAAPVR